MYYVLLVIVGNDQPELNAILSDDSESEEELEVQHWRMEDYQCQLYLKSIQVRFSTIACMTYKHYKTF